jgi:DTW domain-containing protein YfiP
LDLIVIDGTWQQARRIKNRYFQSFPSTTKLGPAALKALSEGDLGQGHQLRDHPVTWKKIATFEAVRLFLVDVWANEKDKSAGSKNTGNSSMVEQEPWEKVQDYVKIANETTIQLGAQHKLR